MSLNEMDEVMNKKRKINHLEVGDAFNLANQSDAAPSSGGYELVEAAQCIDSISSTTISLLELDKRKTSCYRIPLGVVLVCLRDICSLSPEHAPLLPSPSIEYTCA